jgi:hypothetical protein
MSAARSSSAATKSAPVAAAKTSAAKSASMPALGNQESHALLNQLIDFASAAAEREADQMAGQSLRTAVARSLSRVQPHSLTNRELALAPPVVVEGVTSPAVPLDSASRSYFEPRLGVALDRVRVHTNAAAQRSASALKARAYVYGEHVVFATHSFSPQTAIGRALLAHELAHVAQQSRRGAAFLGRQDWRDPRQPGEVVTRLTPGLIQRNGPGYLTVEDIELTYLRVEWDPSKPPPEFTFVLRDAPGRQSIGLRLTGKTEVDVTLDRRFEVAASDIYRLFSYDFNLPGKLHLEDKVLPLPWRFRHLVPPRPYGELPPPIPLNPPTADEMDPFNDSPSKLAPPDTSKADKAKEQEQEMIRGQPSFKTRAEMEEYIRTHPGGTFIGIETSYGKFVARSIDERELIALADELRGDPDRLPEVAWDVEGKRSAWRVSGVYQRGKLVDPAALHNLYYGHLSRALDGTSEDLEECEIYRMGTGAFGRKPLSHDAAVKRWNEFDQIERRAVDKLETEPGAKFVALRVRGVGQVHDLGVSYFDGRDEFRARAAAVRNNSHWIEIYQTLIAGDAGSKVVEYILAESDREQANPAFLATLRGHGELAEAISTLIYDQIAHRAQQIALDAVAEARGQLAPIADNIDSARAFVLGFADMKPDAKTNALRFIGVPESERGLAMDALSNRELAWRIAFGLEETREETESVTVPDDLPGRSKIRYKVTRRISLDKVREWAEVSVKGLDEARTQLQGERDLALCLEGELGNRVREQVYKEFGFNVLKPASFPHRDETQGWFPDPMDPGSVKFASLAEQMYANRVRNDAATKTAFKILAVTALVIVTVVLILVAQAAGAAIAGLLFAEGTALFIATELVASGLIFTALAAVQHRVTEGEWQDPLDLIGHAALNIATFGAFRYLNTLLAAGAKSFAAAGVQRGFFAAERAGAWATGLRIGMIGGAFMGIGLAQRLASGKGFSSWGDFALFAYENLLTIALLEAGAVAAKPLMMKGSIWAREVRLGEFEKPITELQADLMRLQRDLASLSLRPEAAARDAPKLTERTKALLERQKALTEQLRERFRTRSDAKQLEQKAGAEIEAIDAALAGIRQAEFLTDLKITPVQGSESVYTYEGGQAGIERFKKFYGEDKVRVEEDGTIRAEVAGLETRELVFVPAEKYSPTAAPSGTAPPVPPIVQQQLGLQARQQALLSRAKLLGVTHTSLDAIRRKQPTRQTEAKTLRETEELIAKAEREAGKAMDELTQNILKNVRDRLGKDAIEKLRAGELRDITDAQLADVLWQARGLQNMGIPQLRALMFAARPGTPPISFPKLLRTIRRGRFNVADRNFALETFTQMMELRVAGARQMLADMSVSPSKFRGGLFQMEAMRFVGGVEQVASIETREPLGTRAREYDITLRDGTRIECKDWLTWEYADSLGDQFVRDMSLRTQNFANPAGMRGMRYLFRSPPPLAVENIRSFLRGRLERALANESQSVRDGMLREFDAYTDMVQAPQLQRSGGVPLPPPGTPPPVPAWPDDEDEGDDGSSNEPNR